MTLDARIRDLTGRIFGRLRVIEFVEVRNHNAYWLCECDCGTRKIVRGHSMQHGNTVSCGCQRRDPAIKSALRLLLSCRRRKSIARLGGRARSAAATPITPSGESAPRSPLG